MEFRNKKIIIASGITFTLVLFISVAFAALASQLNISFGNVTQNALTWNVGFKGSSVTPTQEGTSSTGLSCGTASVTPSTITIANSTLSKPGDKCIYPLVISNTGDIAAQLSSIAPTEPTSTDCNISGSTMVCGNITYKLTTARGADLPTEITINKNEDYKVKLLVSYTGTDVSNGEVTHTNVKFTFTYSQSSNRVTTGSERPTGVQSSTKCKRATALHTETCSRTDNYGCYSVGYYSGGSKNTSTITYGNLGTSDTLTAGDAFDCDVNGDGTYDPRTERFYYVSGLDGDSASDYAVLIYYTNVSEGVANDAATFAYSSNGDIYNGPVTAYPQLPSTDQWNNVSLSNEARQIYADDNSTTVLGKNLPQFSYTDKAARLLTYKEVSATCGKKVNLVQGELDSCEYLMEHTSYSTSDSNVNPSGWLLETPFTSNQIWVVWGAARNVTRSFTSNSYGVRPAIEVLKTDIDY